MPKPQTHQPLPEDNMSNPHKPLTKANMSHTIISSASKEIFNRTIFFPRWVRDCTLSIVQKTVWSTAIRLHNQGQPITPKAIMQITGITHNAVFRAIKALGLMNLLSPITDKTQQTKSKTISTTPRTRSYDLIEPDDTTEFWHMRSGTCDEPWTNQFAYDVVEFNDDYTTTQCILRGKLKSLRKDKNQCYTGLGVLLGLNRLTIRRALDVLITKDIVQIDTTQYPFFAIIKVADFCISPSTNCISPSTNCISPFVSCISPPTNISNSVLGSSSKALATGLKIDEQTADSNSMDEIPKAYDINESDLPEHIKKLPQRELDNLAYGKFLRKRQRCSVIDTKKILDLWWQWIDKCFAHDHPPDLIGNLSVEYVNRMKPRNRASSIIAVLLERLGRRDRKPAPPQEPKVLTKEQIAHKQMMAEHYEAQREMAHLCADASFSPNVAV